MRPKLLALSIFYTKLWNSMFIVLWVKCSGVGCPTNHHRYQWRFAHQVLFLCNSHKVFLLDSLYRKVAIFFSKIAIGFIHIKSHYELRNISWEHYGWLESWVETFWKKAYSVKSGKKLFVKRKKVYIKLSFSFWNCI